MTIIQSTVIVLGRTEMLLWIERIGKRAETTIEVKRPQIDTAILASCVHHDGVIKVTTVTPNTVQV